MSTQTAQDLLAAADVLRRDGWTRGAFHDESGCHCAAGAIAEAIKLRDHQEFAEEWSDGIIALARKLPGGGTAMAVYAWNDEPGRTADEVIAVLEAAAEAAEQQAQPQSGDRP